MIRELRPSVACPPVWAIDHTNKRGLQDQGKVISAQAWPARDDEPNLPGNHGWGLVHLITQRAVKRNERPRFANMSTVQQQLRRASHIKKLQRSGTHPQLPNLFQRPEPDHGHKESFISWLATLRPWSSYLPSIILDVMLQNYIFHQIPHHQVFFSNFYTHGSFDVSNPSAIIKSLCNCPPIDHSLRNQSNKVFFSFSWVSRATNNVRSQSKGILSFSQFLSFCSLFTHFLLILSFIPVSPMYKYKA
jgi:hypothetical protein